MLEGFLFDWNDIVTVSIRRFEYSAKDKLEVEERKEKVIVIYFSLDFVSHLEWYNFDIILYGHKVQKNIISINLDICYSV